MTEQVQKPTFGGAVQDSGPPLLSAQAGGYVFVIRLVSASRWIPMCKKLAHHCNAGASYLLATTI